MHRIETDRLLLREFIAEDADGIFELDSDPEVHRYLGNRPLSSINQAKEIVQFIQDQYVKNGIGRWAVIEKKSGQFIGWSGLKLETKEVNNLSNYYDLGYRLIPKFWGKGYATESAIAAVNYGFTELGLNTIYGAAHIENQSSNKVLCKLGFQFINRFVYDESQHNWYELKRELLSREL